MSKLRGIFAGHDHLFVLNVDLSGAVPCFGEHLHLNEGRKGLGAAAFILVEDVNLHLHLVMSLHCAWLAQHHASADVITFDTSHQRSKLITSM